MTPEELAIKESRRIYDLLKTKVAISFSTNTRDGFSTDARGGFVSVFPFSTSDIDKIYKFKMYYSPYENSPNDELEHLTPEFKKECKRLYASADFSNETTKLCFEILSNSIKNQKEIKRVTRLQSASLKTDHLGLKQIQITLEGQNAPSFQISHISLPYNTPAGKALYTYLNNIQLADHQKEVSDRIFDYLSGQLSVRIASLIHKLTVSELYALLSDEEKQLIEQKFNLKAISASNEHEIKIGKLKFVNVRRDDDDEYNSIDITDITSFIFQNIHSITASLENIHINTLSISLFSSKRPEPVQDVLIKSLRILQTSNRLELYCDMGYLEGLNIPNEYIPELTPFYKQKDHRGWVLVSSDCFFKENQIDTALAGSINTVIVNKVLFQWKAEEYIYTPQFIHIYPLMDSFDISGTVFNKIRKNYDMFLLETLFKKIHLRYDCVFSLYYLVKIRLDRLSRKYEEFGYTEDEDHLWVRELLPSDYNENIVKLALAPISEIFKSIQQTVIIELKDFFICILEEEGIKKIKFREF